MPRILAPEARQACTHLIKAGHLEDALRLLQTASQHIRHSHDWIELHATLEQIPDHLHQQLQWATLKANILVGLRDIGQTLEFTHTSLAQYPIEEAATIASARAWALLATDQSQNALDLLESALPHLPQAALGAALKRLAQAQHTLGLPWQASANKARTHLQGRALGLALIDEGYLHRQSADLNQARECLNHALPLLRTDRYHLAWARHNLCEVALASNDPDAEHHALEAERLTRHPHARNLRARALCSLGSLRRREGDLQRAEAAFRAAIPAAQEPDDQRTARWSLARTLRLQGRTHDALEQLHSAISQTPTDPHHPIQIELAATWLTLNQPERAQTALEASQHLYDRHADLSQIIWAELHRRQGNGIQALQALEQTNLRTPLAQEEARMWPDLFALAHLAGRDVPTPATPASPPTIEINACGLLRVLVNQRPVRLNPTGRPAELLVLLLEHHGHAPVETLIDQLWPKETKTTHKTQALWQLAKKLRNALGWNESISIQGKVYTLDEHATWHYDARTARHQQQAKTRFLEGIHSDWALEVARELENLQPSRQPSHQPNHLN